MITPKIHATDTFQAGWSPRSRAMGPLRSMLQKTYCAWAYLRILSVL